MSRRTWDCRLGLLFAGVGIMLAPRPGWSGDTGSTVHSQLPAAEKLAAVVEAAWTAGPDLAEALALINAEASANHSLRGPGTPYVQFQVEGIGTSFDNQPNAQQYVRFGTPFDMPWQFSRSRRLAKGLERWESFAADAARLQVVRLVAGSWLQLAAIEERTLVEERRLDRMDRSLKLQAERFNLGEVAGMDVVQIELQRARNASTLRALEAERQAMEAQIQRLAGENVPFPVAGDLQSLAEGSVSPAAEAGGDIEDRVVDGILYSSLLTRAEKERLVSDLIGTTAWGRPEVQVEWEHVPILDGQPSFDALGFNVSVPLPLGKRGGRQAAAARAAAEAASAALERGRRQLVQRAKAALAAAQAAAQRLAETEPVLERLPQTEFSLSEQFRLGAISYLVYIDGLDRLDDLRLQRIESYETLLLARLDLASVLGDSTLFPIPQIGAQIPRETK